MDVSSNTAYLITAYMSETLGLGSMVRCTERQEN